MEYKNLTTIECHIIKAVINKCQTISEIRKFVRELISSKNMIASWSNDAFSSNIRNLCFKKILTRKSDEFQGGFFYGLNQEHLQLIIEYVNAFYKINEMGF